MLKLLLDSKIDLEQAKALACSIVDVVGGPTAAQSAFVTTITGLSAGIFGLYTATGRKWDGGLPADINKRFVDGTEPTPSAPVTTVTTVTTAAVKKTTDSVTTTPPNDPDVNPPRVLEDGEGDGEDGDVGPTM